VPRFLRTLRVRVPTGILAVTQGITVISLYIAASNRQALLFDEVSQRALLDIARLARNAEQLTGAQRTIMREDFSRLGADNKLAAAMLIASDGEIVIANSPQWVGQQAAALLDTETLQVLDTVKSSRNSESLRQGPNTLTVVTGFTEPDATSLRGQQRGVVLLRYELGDAKKQARNLALREHIPDALALLLGALILMQILERSLCRPLRQLREASTAMTAGKFQPITHPQGGEELRELAKAFNNMGLQLSEQMADLKNQAAFIRSVLENTVEGILVVGDDLLITIANRGAARIFDTTAQELLGQPLHRLFAANHPLAPVRLGTTREFSALRAGGERFTIECTAAALTLHERLAHVLVLRDVTGAQSC